MWEVNDCSMVHPFIKISQSDLNHILYFLCAQIDIHLSWWERICWLNENTFPFWFWINMRQTRLSGWYLVTKILNPISTLLTGNAIIGAVLSGSLKCLISLSFFVIFLFSRTARENTWVSGSFFWSISVLLTQMGDNYVSIYYPFLGYFFFFFSKICFLTCSRSSLLMKFLAF